LIDDVDLASAAYRVNSMAFAVVEDIVGIAGDLDLRNDIARIGVKHDKPGGEAAADKQSMIRFVERHREVAKGQVCFPCCNDFAFVAIDNRHMTRIGNIDENSATVFLQLKSFGVCVEFDRADLFSIGRINSRNASTAKSDIDFFRRFIVTDIVGVIFKIQFAHSLE
jgi:hypothetical protein